MDSPKKIVIAGDLSRRYAGTMSFLDRRDILIFEADTNDDILKIHIREHADLIVSRVDMPGRKSEELFEIIRSSKSLQNVYSILLSAGDRIQQVRCTQCSPNLVLPLPLDPEQLNRHVHRLLGVGYRQSRRVPYITTLLARTGRDPFDCNTLDISSTGILFESQENLGRGQDISFSFLLPDQTVINGYAEIMRIIAMTPPYGAAYGVQIKDVEDSVRQAIERFVSFRK